MKAHVSEELLNMYLDGELSRRQHIEIEAHIQACEACRSELLALQNLFESLEKLRHAPVPDLWPQVEARLSAKRLHKRLLWLGLALQGFAALILLIWGWDRLAALATRISEAIGPTFVNLGLDFSGWWAEIWRAVSSWPGIIRENLQAWSGELQGFAGRGITVQHGILLVVVLVTAWLVGNLLLLRHPHGKEASR